ncbi:hypothetical protein BH20ACT5_BH20ACT5_08290 [soil metagenome]
MPALTTIRLRMPRSALLAVGLFMICAIPLASVSPWLLALLGLPALAGIYVWRGGMDLDASGVTVRSAFGTVAVPWDDIAGLAVRGRGVLWLARRDGTALRLPVLRARDLPRLHAASAGRLGVPGPVTGPTGTPPPARPDPG